MQRQARGYHSHHGYHLQSDHWYFRTRFMLIPFRAPALAVSKTANRIQNLRVDLLLKAICTGDLSVDYLAACLGASLLDFLIRKSAIFVMPCDFFYLRTPMLPMNYTCYRVNIESQFVCVPGKNLQALVLIQCKWNCTTETQKRLNQFIQCR